MRVRSRWLSCVGGTVFRQHRSTTGGGSFGTRIAIRGGFVPVNVTETEQRIDQALPVRIVWPQGVIMEIPATDRELVLLVAGTLAGSEVRS